MSPAEPWSVVSQLPQHVQALIALALIVVAPVPLSLAFTIAHSGCRPTSLSYCAVVVGMSWLSLQTFLALGLGLVGRLTLGHVLLAESIVLAFGVVAVARYRAALRVGGATRRTPDAAEAGILACLATVAAWLLYQTVTTPVSEYDSLAYHLPAVANWYRTAGLDMLGQGSVDYYPYNFELIALLFVLPFRGHFAVGLAQLLAWSLFGLAVHAVARLLGARRLHGLLAALLVLTQPLVLRLASDTLQVDLAFAAAFLITIYAALAYVFRGLHWSLVVLSGAWLAGTKASGLGYLLLIVLMILVARKSFARQAPTTTVVEPRGPPAVVVLLSLLAALTNGGFWYARNLITSGNPLGFVGLTLFRVPIFDGPIAAAELRRSSLAAMFRIVELSDWMILLKQLAVNLGLPFALLVIAAGMLVAVRTDTTPFWRDRPALLVLALFALCAASYVFTPFSGDNGTYGWRVSPWIGQGLRFALPAVGVLAVAAALGMTRFGRFDTALAAIATTAGLLSLPRNRLPVLLIFGVVWLWILRGHELPGWSRRVMSYGLILVLIISSLVFRNLKDAAYARIFPVVAFIDRHVGHGEKIGLLVTNRASVFFGTRLTADVMFVPHGEADASRWVRTLQALNIRFIGVGPILEDWWLSSNEVRWLDSDHHAFEKVHGTDYRRGSVLYRILDVNSAAGGAP